MLSANLAPKPALPSLLRIAGVAIAGLGTLVIAGPFFLKRRTKGVEKRLIIGGACLVALTILEVVVWEIVWRANNPAE